MRIGFVMPRSVTEAMECFPPDQQLAAYQAINRYALDGEGPVFDENHRIAEGIFILAKPFLDSNNRRYENGKKGGRPKAEEKPNHNQTVTETKPNHNQTITKPEVNGNQIVEKKNSRKEEKEKSGTVEEGNPPIAPRSINAVPRASEEDLASVGVPPALTEQVSQWIANKDARRETLTENEFKSFVSTVNANAARYGVKAVSDLIKDAMSNGYKGIPWDRLERRARDKPTNTFLQDLMEVET